MASVFWFILFVSILIAAHELGHFLFAKLFRVKVLVFSLGFGGPIRLGRIKLAFEVGETEYRLAWFPIGGFVRMLGFDALEDIPADQHARAFLTQAPWKRFLIIVAGPAFSVLLAIPIFFAFYLTYTQAVAPVIGQVIGGAPAAQAGLRPGDRILAIDGTPTPTWDDIEDTVLSSGGREVQVRIERGGETLERQLRPQRRLDETGLYLLGDEWELGIAQRRQSAVVSVLPDSPAAAIGLRTWDQIIRLGGQPIDAWEDALQKLRDGAPIAVAFMRQRQARIGAIELQLPMVHEAILEPLPRERAPQNAPLTAGFWIGLEPADMVVQNLLQGYPAEAAGVRPNDRIVALFGQPVDTWDQYTRILLEHRDQEIPITLRRGFDEIEVLIRPAALQEQSEIKQVTRRPGIGVSYSPRIYTAEGVPRIPRPDLFTFAARMAVLETGRTIVMNVNGFVRIFERKVELKEAIGGPLMIFDVANRSAERGLGHFFRMLAFLSVLIGMLNMLPIPILDGGHILFILIEAVQRRPLSMGARAVAMYIGLVLILTLFVFALYNDISRYWFQ